MKINYAIALCICGFAGAMEGATVSDDFNRADTTYSTNVAVSVGESWFRGIPSGQFRIQNGMVQYGVGSAGVPLLHSGLETLNHGAHEYTLRAINELYNGAINPGVVFHYQNPTNYYFARYLPGSKTLQVLRRVDGAETSFASAMNASMPDHVNPTRYEFIVTSDSPYQFAVSVRELDSEEMIQLEATDGQANFLGGYAGFWASSGQDTAFDDFELEVIAHTIIVDDFNRADTGFVMSNNVPSTIGFNWVSAGTNPSNTFRIIGQRLDYGSGFTGSPGLLVNTALETRNDDGYGFVLSGEGWQDDNAFTMVSMVWNLQDSQNYYYARYISNTKFLQAFRVVDGVDEFIESAAGAHMPDWVNGKGYAITITSSEPYVFTIVLRDMDTDDEIQLQVTDTDEHFTGGYGGFHGGAGALFYDNFRLEIVSDEDELFWLGPVSYQGNGSIGIALLTVDGQVYVLEYTTDLTSDPVIWNAVDDVVGDGAEKTLTDPNPAGAARMYRVVVE